MKLRILPRGPLRWAIASLRTRGFVQTAKVAWSFFADLSFDLKHGTETIRRVEMSSLDIHSANKVHATRYGATKERPFMELIKGLNIPSNSVFVDIGCGKGKVLLMAAECGFKKIVGIDFSPELCRLAGTNIAAFEKKTPLNSLIEIVECDAALYRFRSDENVFFTFDPFNAAVLEQVLNNLRSSLVETPRKIWFIYHSPEHHETMEKARLFQSWKDFDIIGTHFKVYVN